jgi:hypothetical protein
VVEIRWHGWIVVLCWHRSMLILRRGRGFGIVLCRPSTVGGVLDRERDL